LSASEGIKKAAGSASREMILVLMRASFLVAYTINSTQLLEAILAQKSGLPTAFLGAFWTSL
jgi:5,10-methylenetetrahydrofolate reductase